MLLDQAEKIATLITRRHALKHFIEAMENDTRSGMPWAVVGPGGQLITQLEPADATSVRRDCSHGACVLLDKVNQELLAAGVDIPNPTAASQQNRQVMQQTAEQGPQVNNPQCHETGDGKVSLLKPN